MGECERRGGREGVIHIVDVEAGERGRGRGRKRGREREEDGRVD